MADFPLRHGPNIANPSLRYHHSNLNEKAQIKPAVKVLGCRLHEWLGALRCAAYSRRSMTGMFVTDLKNGNGNSWHEYGTGLTTDERRAIIE